MLWSHICWFLVVIVSIFSRIRSKKHYIILWRTKRTYIYFWYIFQINLLNSTNSYDDGVGIQASRFNHSCSPNAEFEWDESISASGIRTGSVHVLLSWFYLDFIQILSTPIPRIARILIPGKKCVTWKSR